MRQKKPWWRCTKCGIHLAKAKTKGVDFMMLEHRKTCTAPDGEAACFQIVEVEQGKEKYG